MTIPDRPPDRTDEIAGPGVGHVLAGRYVLRRLLGTGGMSRVLLAHDRELDREVAVKLLTRPGGADELGRLRDEARAAAAIDHPGVVTVHDVGVTDAGVHVVMSYVEGESLAARLERSGPMSPIEVVSLGRAVCDALGAAHRAGVVHRDVSPGNILLRPDGGVTVTDFGIARIGEGAGRTATGHVVGTPAYMAPEQGRGAAELDGRADLYALGCCLFTALTGRPPFTDPDPMSVLLAHMRETPPRPSAVRAGVPPALEAVLLRALAKDPGLRHPDASTMAAALAESSPSAMGDRPDRTHAMPATGGTSPLPTAADDRTRALDRAVADAEGEDGAASDRRRTAGLVLLALAAVLVLSVVAALLLT